MLQPAAANPRTVWLALAAVYVIWGSTYFAMRVVVESVPPFFMAGSRFLIAGGGMGLFLRLRGTPWPTRGEWLSSVVLGGKARR